METVGEFGGKEEGGAGEGVVGGEVMSEGDDTVVLPGGAVEVVDFVGDAGGD